MLSTHKKVGLAAGATISLMLLIATAAKPVVYIGGLILLEIVNPRAVSFQGPPDNVWEDGFELTTDVSCNWLYERNILLNFYPDLPFVLGENAKPEGSVFFQLTTATEKYEAPLVPLRTKGRGGRASSVAGDSVAWIKPVSFPEYPVLGDFECEIQQVHLKLHDLNFDPRNYTITITIQRIGIDG